VGVCRSSLRGRAVFFGMEFATECCRKPLLYKDLRKNGGRLSCLLM